MRAVMRPVHAVGDRVHAARVFAAAGLVRPTRPDRALRALLALHRWGPTPAAGYEASAARYPDEPAIVDELGVLSFALAEGRDVDDALAFGARCGAACLTGRGPFEGQLRLER